MKNENTHSFQSPKLLQVRGVAWCILSFERLWPRLMPCCLILLFLATISWFGIFDFIGFWSHLIILALLLISASASLIMLKSFHFPSRKDVDHRIEISSGLKNQPIDSQSDQIVNASDSPFAALLWAEHQRRMAQKLEHLQSGVPNAEISKYDPYALRSIVVLFAVIGFIFSFGPLGGRFFDSFNFQPRIDLNALRIDAWITPPPYTNEAPIYLTRAGMKGAKIPEGSKLTVRIVDAPGSRLTTIDDENSTITDIKADISKDNISDKNLTFETILNQSLSVVLSAYRYEKKWHFDVMKDTSPTIRLTKEPGRVLSGAIELNYSMDDDYGVEKAFVAIQPTINMHTGGHPLYDAPQIELLIPRGGKGEGRTVQDLTNHPWAGSEIRLTLVAQDGAGHIARSKSRTMVLPQHSFGNPLARAIVEQRRLLALNSEAKNRVLDMLSALLVRAEDTQITATQVLVLNSAWSRLSLAQSDDQLRDVVDYLWQIAVGIDGDNISDAEKRLKEAQAALRDALRNGASPEEIERLTDELRQAMKDYMTAYAEAVMRGDIKQKPADNSKSVGREEMEDKLKQLEDMAKTGNRGAAEQLLSELENLMNNLQVGSGGGGEGSAGNQNDEMQKQMNRLGDLMRRQQEALNDTHKLEEQKQGQDTSPDDYQKQLDELQKKQDELQSELKGLQKDLQKKGLKPGDDLSNAEKEMQQSGKALGKGDGKGSADNQTKALESLRKGAQALMKQMQDGMKNGSGNNGMANTDPLGRKLGPSGSSRDQNENKLPLESDVQRARRILDEIRKRLGNSFTPEMEKDYLERLLKFD